MVHLSSLVARARALSFAGVFIGGAALAILVAGCSDAQPCATCGTGGEGGATASGGGGGAGTCTSTKGTLQGTVYRWAPPGGQDSEIAANATVVLLSAPGATPLNGKADAAGHYTIELDAGSWIVGGEDNGGCQSSEPKTVTLDPCETEEVEVVLDICTG